MKTIQNSETSIPKIGTKGENAQTHAEQLEANSKIRWDDNTFTAHLGYLPGEKHYTYFIFRRRSGAYALYGTRTDEDGHIADFKDLENAKAFAEYVEKSSSTSIDVIIHPRNWGRLNEQISN